MLIHFDTPIRRSPAAPRLGIMDRPRALEAAINHRIDRVLGRFSPMAVRDGARSDVMLTLTHARASSASVVLGVSAGWHGHLDLLGATFRSEQPEPFWDR